MEKYKLELLVGCLDSEAQTLLSDSVSSSASVGTQSKLRLKATGQTRSNHPGPSLTMREEWERFSVTST